MKAFFIPLLMAPLVAFSQGTPRIVATLAELTNSVPSERNPFVFVVSRVATNDWGPTRLAKYDASATNATDNGCVFATTTGTGRWLFQDCYGATTDRRWYGTPVSSPSLEIKAGSSLTVAGSSLDDLVGTGLRNNSGTLAAFIRGVAGQIVISEDDDTPYGYTTDERNSLTLLPSDAGSIYWDTDLGAAFTWSGTAWGEPLTLGVMRDDTSNTLAKLQIVAGTIRQSGFYTNRHYFITNSTHTPIGTSGDYAAASGGEATFALDRTYGKMITALAFPDESFAYLPGLRSGFKGSAALNTATVSATAPFHGDMFIKYNGSAWVVTDGLGANIAGVAASYAFGQLTITHNYCRGIALTVDQWSDNGAVTNPYIPVGGVLQNEYFVIQWIDPAFGTAVSGAASTRMTAHVRKLAPMGLYLDGQYGSTNINGVIAPTQANIWFLGIYEQ